MADLFPILVDPLPPSNCVYEFRKDWLRIRPEGFSWYYFYVNILSPTEVEFVVHDIGSETIGGVGRESGRFKTTVSAEQTKKFMVRRARELAEGRRAMELADIERKIIGEYTDSFLAEYGLSVEKNDA